MRSSSCIFARRRDGEETVLFEGGQPIPFFWLMLLGKDDIDTFHNKLKKAENEPDTERSDTVIVLDKLRALHLAALRREFVSRYYAVCLRLYDDWLYFMQTADFADMRIYVDLYETSHAHQNLSQFIDSLHKAIDCFDSVSDAWYDVTIAGTCGREANNANRRRFSNMSKAYSRMNRNDIYGAFDNKVHLEKKHISRTAKRLLMALFAAIMIAVAAWVLYHFMQQ